MPPARKNARRPPESAHCNSCGRKTNHIVLTTRTQSGEEPYDERISIWWSTVFTLLECAGCNSVCLRREHFFSEWDDGVSQVEYFPPPIFRDLPAWADRLPRDEQELLEEVYRALAAGSMRLVMMGTRTLIDMFMLRTVGDVGDFDKKLTALETMGYVSSMNREMVAAAVDAGSASAHRGFVPLREHLEAAMDIVESFLHIDLLRADAGNLKKAVPLRKSRGKQAQTSPPPAQAQQSE